MISGHPILWRRADDDVPVYSGRDSELRRTGSASRADDPAGHEHTDGERERERERMQNEPGVTLESNRKLTAANSNGPYIVDG